MNAERVREFLALLGCHDTVDRGSWISAPCPLAFARHSGGKDNNPSFGITVEPERESLYNCFACHSKGGLDTLLHELRHLSRGTEHARRFRLAQAFAMLEQQTDEAYYGAEWGTPTPITPPFVPFPDSYLDQFRPAYVVPRALKYLRSRGVSPAMTERYRIVYDLSTDSVAVPFFSRDGTLAGLRGRSLIGKEYRDYKYSGKSNVGRCWMGENLCLTYKPVVVVEGMFDWLAVRRYYSNVLACLSTSASDYKIKQLAYFPSVYVFYDHDQAGDDGAARIKKALPDMPVVRVRYPEEAIEAGHLDPGSMSDEELVAALDVD